LRRVYDSVNADLEFIWHSSAANDPSLDRL